MHRGNVIFTFYGACHVYNILEQYAACNKIRYAEFELKLMYELSNLKAEIHADDTYINFLRHIIKHC
jgi:hypothetical protein